MKNIDIIDTAYNLANTHFKNKEFTFDKLTSLLLKELEIKKEEFTEQLGSLYVDLMQDSRFILMGENKWNLKENLSSSAYKKQLNALYDFSTEIHEDHIDDEELKKIRSHDEEHHDHDHAFGHDIDDKKLSNDSLTYSSRSVDIEKILDEDKK